MADNANSNEVASNESGIYVQDEVLTYLNSQLLMGCWVEVCGCLSIVII